MKASSSVVIRRGRPPAHRGSREAIPVSLKRWIISRTRSGEVWTSRAITSTLLPPAEASTTVARRQRTWLLSVLPPPRRTIRCRLRPSSSESRRTLTGLLMPPPWRMAPQGWWTRTGRGMAVRALAGARCQAAAAAGERLGGHDILLDRQIHLVQAVIAVARGAHEVAAQHWERAAEMARTTNRLAAAAMNLSGASSHYSLAGNHDA